MSSHPLTSPSPPAFNLSQHQGLFQWASSLYQVAKVLELQNFSISPSNEHSGLISFRIDRFDLLPVQRTLKSLQHDSSKVSVLWHLTFFMVQLSHPYVTTGKNHSFDYMGTLDSKVMSQLFNMLSRFVIVFLPRSKCLLISADGCSHHLQWFWSPPK